MFSQSVGQCALERNQYSCVCRVTQESITTLHIGDEDCEPLAKFGQIQKFEPDNELFSTYIEHLELFFEANDVADGKRVPVLLSVIGAKN